MKQARPPRLTTRGTIILLHIPIRRSVEAEPDGVAHRAFLVPIGGLELGIACGALFVHEKRYYKDLLNQQPATAWREQPILPMAVLTQNDRTAAMRQSGVTEEGQRAYCRRRLARQRSAESMGRSGWGR